MKMLKMKLNVKKPHSRRYFVVLSSSVLGEEFRV